MNEKIDQNLGRDRNEKKKFHGHFLKDGSKTNVEKVPNISKETEVHLYECSNKDWIGWTVLYTFHSRILRQFDNE